MKMKNEFNNCEEKDESITVTKFYKNCFYSTRFLSIIYIKS